MTEQQQKILLQVLQQSVICKQRCLEYSDSLPLKDVNRLWKQLAADIKQIDQLQLAGVGVDPT